MKYIRIDKDNMLNGPGIRLVLWVSGCNHHCKECHNPESWDKNTGNEFTDETISYILNELRKPYYNGFTITGGDPFFPENRKDIFNLLSVIKTKLPEKNIWCWSGYTLEKLIPEFSNKDSLEYNILKNIDVLVDGRFDIEQRKIDLKQEHFIDMLRYRGSSNQRIIDIQKSLQERRIIENG